MVFQPILKRIARDMVNVVVDGINEIKKKNDEQAKQEQEKVKKQPDVIQM